LHQLIKAEITQSSNSGLRTQYQYISQALSRVDLCFPELQKNGFATLYHMLAEERKKELNEQYTKIIDAIKNKQFSLLSKLFEHISEIPMNANAMQQIQQNLNNTLHTIKKGVENEVLLFDFGDAYAATNIIDKINPGLEHIKIVVDQFNAKINEKMMFKDLLFKPEDFENFTKLMAENLSDKMVAHMDSIIALLELTELKTATTFRERLVFVRRTLQLQLQLTKAVNEKKH